MSKLHPDAASILNEIAFSISCTRQVIDRPRPAQQPWGDSYIAAHLTDKDIIGDLRQYERDSTGGTVAFSAYVNDEPFSISEEQFLQVRKLVERVLGITEYKHLLSEKYVEDLTIDWCIDTHCRGGTKAFSDYMIERTKRDVGYHHLWIPTAHLQIQNDFRFGSARLVTISRTFFDAKERAAMASYPDQNEAIREHYNKLRSELQGSAAVAVDVKGEPRFVSQYAQTTAEAAVALLRFFHTASVTSTIYCPTTLLGSEISAKLCSIRIIGIDNYEYSKSIKYRHAQPWRLSQAEYADCCKRGLDLAGSLIEGGQSEFGERLRTSILVYSKGMTFPDISDRLVYTFSALEGLLLRDASEPIQQNLAERIAFITVQDPNDRMNLVKKIKKMYSARSQYIHHRRNASLSRDVLDTFFLYASSALLWALQNLAHFKRTDDFFNAIDRMKFA